jgi:choline kinase
VITSDVLAAPLPFERVCRCAVAGTVLVDRDQVCGVEETRVTTRDGLVVDFGKNLPIERRAVAPGMLALETRTRV